MKTLDTFSFSRMNRLLSSTLTEGRSRFLLQIILMQGALLLSAILSGIFSSYSYSGDYEPYQFGNPTDPAILNETVFFVIGLWAFSSLSASLILSNMKSKELRLSTIMLPATQPEKYLSRWLIYIPGFFVIFIAECLVADLARTVIFNICYPYSNVPITTMFSVINLHGLLTEQSTYTMIAIMLCTQSFFVLGSALWPKASFIKTFAAMAAIQFLYTIVVSIAMASLILNTEGFYSPIIKFITSELSISVICVIITFFNWIMSYVRFRESEIIMRW